LRRPDGRRPQLEREARCACAADRHGSDRRRRGQGRSGAGRSRRKRKGGDGRAAGRDGRRHCARAARARRRRDSIGAGAMRLGVEAALVEGALVPGDVEVVDGVVTAYGLAGPNGSGIAVPGFVDLQVNGFAGVDLMRADADGYRRAGEALLETSVTAYLPTFISAPEEDLLAALGNVPAAVALVTDAVAAAGMGDGVYLLAGSEIEVTNGVARSRDDVLAGSSLTMIEAVRNLHGLGVPLAEAVAAATVVPARVLGAHDLGRLQVGLAADLIILDDNLEIERVCVGGEDRVVA